MNRTECINALKLCRRYWKDHYIGMTPMEKDALVGLWERSFPRESFDHIQEALVELSMTAKKHPQIHEIRQVVWKNHGRPVDSENLRRVYKMLYGKEWSHDDYMDSIRST